MVLFRCDGGSVFDVAIYDYSCCEKFECGDEIVLIMSKRGRMTKVVKMKRRRVVMILTRRRSIAPVTKHFRITQELLGHIRRNRKSLLRKVSSIVNTSSSEFRILFLSVLTCDVNNFQCI